MGIKARSQEVQASTVLKTRCMGAIKSITKTDRMRNSQIREATITSKSVLKCYHAAKT